MLRGPTVCFLFSVSTLNFFSKCVYELSGLALPFLGGTTLVQGFVMFYASFSVRWSPPDLPAGENQLAFLFATSYFFAHPLLPSPP